MHVHLANREMDKQQPINILEVREKFDNQSA